MTGVARLAGVSFQNLQQQQPDGVLTLKALQAAMDKTTNGIYVDTAVALDHYFGVPFKDWSCWNHKEATAQCKRLMHYRAALMDPLHFTATGEIYFLNVDPDEFH
jgi:hypothetical protein